MTEKIYDVVIIGAGVAGLSAGLYASRAKLDTLIIEKEVPGGQIKNTNEVANYPGSERNVNGSQLIERMVEQAEEFGAKKTMDKIVAVDLAGDIKTIEGENETYKTRTVIIATGAKPRLMGVKGEDEFAGRGVSYCVTCDGAFFQDLEAFVIGGGDAAVEEAMQLSKFAKKVYVVHRRDELRAAKSIQEKAFQNNKLEFIWDSVVKELKGDMMLNEVVLENLKTKEVTSYKASEEDGLMGVFPYIGFLPETDIFEGKIDMEKGYILTDVDMTTNVEGVFAAGDNRVKPLRQVITAASDGAIAAVEADKYIARKF